MNRVEATKASIIHWRDNERADDPSKADVSGSGCALCGLYFKPQKPPLRRCEGCPVLEVTGIRLCWLTPFQKAVDAMEDWKIATRKPKDGLEQYAAAFRRAAKAEADWLEQVVLPKAIEMGDEE